MLSVPPGQLTSHKTLHLTGYASPHLPDVIPVLLYVQSKYLCQRPASVTGTFSVTNTFSSGKCLPPLVAEQVPIDIAYPTVGKDRITRQ